MEVLTWQDYRERNAAHEGDAELVIVLEEGVYSLWWLGAEEVPLPAIADDFQTEAEAQTAAAELIARQSE
jgi:hypothetical protein